jgi:cell division transport system permease protein
MDKQNKISATRVFNARFNATVSITLVLLLTGIMLILAITAKNLSKNVKENISLSVIIDETTPLPDIKMLQGHLEKSVWAKSVEYVDKETAMKDLVENLGENPEAFLGANPLLESFEIFLHAPYANSDSIAKIEKSLKTFSSVDEVLYRKDLIELVNNNIRRVGFVLLILAALLTFISFSLIRNTVRLMIYSKRFIIRTMQLVGASNNFIRKPFLLENMWVGVVSAILSTACLWGLIAYLEQRMEGTIQLITPATLGIVFLILLFFGVLIIVGATWLAVSKYLKMNVSHLYYV